MNFSLLYDNPEESLLTRLLTIRNVKDNHEDFLDPTYQVYWQSYALLSHIEPAIQRISQAISANEKIMIFGDYDVDGIMSSYVLYTFFRKFLGYHNISVRLPHRMQDGYGIKSYHIDQIIAEDCSLIITVDNGITAIEEASHAKEKGIDIIVTDHHKVVDGIPDCCAVINPQISEKMPFKEICGAAVALKVCFALADHFALDPNTKKTILDELLPFVSIATVADCMPLVDENRLMVKKGLEIMNTKRHTIAPSLQFLLQELNIQKIDTFHIGFMIAPRLNATGRMGTAMDGLKTLLFSDHEKLSTQFALMDSLNKERKSTQDKMVKQAQALIDIKQMFMVAAHEDFHEGIVGIVAGRIAEKNYKPTMILGIDKEKGIATGSLRGPDYFSIIDMLKSADDLLERYGGHEQAGGVTVLIDNLEPLIQRLCEYCTKNISEDNLQKKIVIDTQLYSHELDAQTLHAITKLGPYGQGNQEPLFLLDNVMITHAQQIGKEGSAHLKLTATKDNTTFTIMQRRKGDQIDTIKRDVPLRVVGKIKDDTYNGGFYVDGKEIIVM